MSVRIGILWTLGLVIAAVLLLQGPMAQDAAYHQFVDDRAWSDIPNWQNVLSNIPFIYVGILGLVAVSKKLRQRENFGEKASWFLLFFGIFATGFGSAYYHWRPSNESLLWDRLPMTIGFTALFAGLIGERISSRFYHVFLWPIVALGIGSVIYWYETEIIGLGDLRLYFLVQFLPLILIPVILFLFPAVHTHGGYLMVAILLYLAAKICEIYDVQIYDLTQEIISGHVLKHLIAATACGALYLLFIDRKRIYAHKDQ